MARIRGWGRWGVLSLALVAALPVGAAAEDEIGVAVVVREDTWRALHVWRHDGRAEGIHPLPVADTYVCAPDGRRVAFLQDGRAALHPLDLGEPMDLGPATAIAFSPHTGRLALARASAIRVMQDRDAQVRRDYPVPHTGIAGLTWVGEDRLLFIADDPRTLVSLDLSTGESQPLLRSQNRTLVDVAPSPLGDAVALMWQEPAGRTAYTLFEFAEPKHSPLHRTTTRVEPACTWDRSGGWLVVVDAGESGAPQLARIDISGEVAVTPMAEAGRALAPALGPRGMEIAFLEDDRPRVYHALMEQRLTLGTEGQRALSRPQWVPWRETMYARVAQPSPPNPQPRGMAIAPPSAERAPNPTAGFPTPRDTLRAVVAAVRARDEAGVRAACATDDERGETMLFMLLFAISEDSGMPAQMIHDLEHVIEHGGELIPNPTGNIVALPYTMPGKAKQHYFYFSKAAEGGWLWNVRLSEQYEDGPLPW